MDGTIEMTEIRKPRRNPSLVSLAMARTARKPAGASSMDAKALMRGLYKGVLLDDNKVKFWIDQKLHENCFMVLSKGLDIKLHGQENSFTWNSYEEDCFGGPVDVDEARLQGMNSIQISGGLPSIMRLSPMATYEVVLKLMKIEAVSGTLHPHQPLHVALILPDGARKTGIEFLEPKPKGEWVEIPLGAFEATPETVGTIQFFLSSGSWFPMGSLAVRGVSFRPKYSRENLGV